MSTEPSSPQPQPQPQTLPGQTQPQQSTKPPRQKQKQQQPQKKAPAPKSKAVEIEDPGDEPYCDSHVHLDMMMESMGIPLNKIQSIKDEKFKYASFVVNVCCTPNDIESNSTLLANNPWIYGAFGCLC